MWANRHDYIHFIFQTLSLQNSLIFFFFLLLKFYKYTIITHRDCYRINFVVCTNFNEESIGTISIVLVNIQDTV